MKDKSFGAFLLTVLGLSTLANLGCVGISSSNSAASQTYTISGTISPYAGGSAANVILGGAASATTITDNLGNYSFSGLASGNYTVTPRKSDFRFSPSSRSETISTSDVTGINFSASQPGSGTTYSISGTISPAANGAGVTILLAGAASASTTTDSSGKYTFSGLASGSYTLTPSDSAYSFSPAGLNETIAAANVTGADFAASRLMASIPASFWGLIINGHRYTPQVPYGQFRGWDAVRAQWPNLELCKAASGNPDDACFDWTTDFDPQMASLFAAGVNDVFYTMSRTPQWAVDLARDPTGLNGRDCNYYVAGSSDPGQAPGQCLLPVDLNADGSGTDQIWKNWITAIAAHVNDPTYLQSHAHIKYWEPWNEFYRGSIVLPRYVTNGQMTVSYAGTYAQMVRLTEDMRCVITGKGTIHNFPSAGRTTPCTATPIDANAMIVAPDGAASSQGPINVIQNFLYCNGTGSAAPAAGSYCTTGNAGSQAVDIINFHLYAATVTPETVVNTQIPNVRAMLQPADLAKPMINGEGSWNIPSKSGNLWSDPYAQAGFIPRFFALYWSAGLMVNTWYSYDSNDGQLFYPSTGTLNEPAATSWTLTYNTLVGATPINTPFCSNNGNIYTCDFKEANGSIAELIWDAQYAQNCSQTTNPIICGSTNYSVPTQFNKDWVDMNGVVHSSAATVTIGANPILLEGQN